MIRNIGLSVLGLLSVLDVADLALTDGRHPPYPVAIVGAVLGVASLVLVGLAWRERQWAVAPLIGLRALSALSAAPAFFAGGVPAPVVGLAAGIVVLTVLGVVLVTRPLRGAERLS